MAQQIREFTQIIIPIMLMGVGFGVMKPMMLQKSDKYLYYATLEHPDPIIAYLLKRQNVIIHEYTSAYNTNQARRNLMIRYPSHIIIDITRVEKQPRREKLLQTITYAPVNPLYAAEEWVSLSSGERTIIEQRATASGEQPFIYWLKITNAYDDWSKIRKYYDEVHEISRRYELGEIDYPRYPSFPSITKALKRKKPAIYPEDIEACARRYPRETLLRMARGARIHVSGSNKDICFTLKQAGIFLQTGVTTPKQNRIWLVYITHRGTWGASDITPKVPPNYYKGYFEKVGMVKALDADKSIKVGTIKEYWVIEAPDRYRAIKIAKSQKRCTECGKVIDWSKVNPEEKLIMNVLREQLCAKCFRKLYPS